MKIRTLAKTLLAVLFTSAAFADVEGDRAMGSEHRYAFGMDPISWVSGNFRPTVEVSLNDRLAFNMPLSFGIANSITKNNYFAGGYFAPKFGVKYYVSGKATHQGFYVNPLLGLFVGKIDAPAGSQSNTNDITGGLTYGFRMGYAWNIWKGLWMDSYVGFESFAASFNSEKNNNVPMGDGFTNKNLLNVGMMVGYVF